MFAPNPYSGINISFVISPLHTGHATLSPTLSHVLMHRQQYKCPHGVTTGSRATSKHTLHSNFSFVPPSPSPRATSESNDARDVRLTAPAPRRPRALVLARVSRRRRPVAAPRVPRADVVARRDVVALASASIVPVDALRRDVFLAVARAMSSASSPRGAFATLRTRDASAARRSTRLGDPSRRASRAPIEVDARRSRVVARASRRARACADARDGFDRHVG